MNKIYARINWENYPSDSTPLNDENLNRIDHAVNELDNRIISQDASKANKAELNNLIKDWIIDETTGIITITKVNGSKVIFDLNIEKVPVSFSLSDDCILTMETEDGSAFTADIGSMIPVLNFQDSDDIAVSVEGTGINKTYSFSIKAGAVTEDKLQPDFLADIRVEAAKAQADAQAAAQSALNANSLATLSKSYAVGGTGSRENENIDNARYYKEQAEKLVGNVVTGDISENIVSFTSDDVGPDGDHMLLDVEKLTSGEKLKELLNKGSRIVTNVRYLIKLLGSNDISSLGNGTVTGAITAMNEALSGKQDEIKLTGSRALVSNSSGKIAVSAVTATELGYLDGVTANIQSQINNLNNIKITQTSGWIDPGAVTFNQGNYAGSWQSGGVQYSWIQIDGGTLQMQISIANVSHALLIRTKIKSQTWSSIPWRTI